VTYRFRELSRRDRERRICEAGGLERTIIHNRRGDHDESVERRSDGGDPNNDGGNGQVDRPKVLREGISEEKRGRLEHEGKALHDEIETSRDRSAKFALAVPAFVCFGTSDFGLAEAV